MNSHLRKILLYAVISALLVGAVLAVAQQSGGGGGERSYRAERRSLPEPTAARPAGGTQTRSRAAPRRQRSTPAHRRVTYPDEGVSTTGAKHAVAAFMPGFLAWSEDRAPAGEIKNATARFIAQARSHPPNVTPAERREHIRVRRIRVLAGHPTVAVVDLSPNGGVRFELDFYLVHVDDRWQISQLATLG